VCIATTAPDAVARGAETPTNKLLQKEIRKRAAEKGKKMTAEQNAFISGCMAILMAAVVASSSIAESIFFESDTPFFSIEVPGVSAALESILAGCIHFMAYYSTLRAYNQVSSTVITPLLQFSAVLLLPMNSGLALWKGAAIIRPAHAAAVLFIIIGGVLPISNGHLKAVLTAEFWVQPAVKACLLGELLVACYNLALHELTFTRHQRALGVFVWSRVGNFLTCMAVFSFTPRLRAEIRGLSNVSKRFLAICCGGELASICGILIVTFSYARFYEPAVVNAAEGGLQQLFNLLLAAMLAHISSIPGMPPWIKSLGRPLTDLPVKLTSLLFISFGLALSCFS
jgi:hypothetical protein